MSLSPLPRSDGTRRPSSRIAAACSTGAPDEWDTAGKDCTRCHSTKTACKQSRSQFDHTTARFQLTGAHREVACEKCHKTSVFRGVAFGTCSACHETPHGKKFPATCATCHTTEKWGTRSVDHSKTSFPLVGAHAQVTCTKCHQSAAMTKPVRFNQCSACHVNVHRDSLKEDCRASHRNQISGSAVRPCQTYGVRARRQARRRDLSQVPHRYFSVRRAAGTKSGGLRRRPARVRRVSWRQGSTQRRVRSRW
jgi:hypothetical protein